MNERLDGQQGIGRPRRKILIAVAAVVVAGAVVTGTILVIHRNSSSQTAASYREYSVSKGDVTVGTTESGTVALQNDTVAFPVESTISSVLVQSGQKVKKGDALVKLDLSSVNDSTSETRQKLEAAKASLQSAISDQKIKLDTAKLTYESSKYLATTAPLTRQLTVSGLQNDIASAKQTLANDQKSLSEYQAMQKTWSADYAKLQQLKKWTTDAQSSETSYNNQLTAFEDANETVLDTYDALKKTADTAGQQYAADKYNKEADDDTTDADEETYKEAKDTLNSYAEEIAGTIVTQRDSLKAKVAQATAEYNNYNSAYSDFKDTYGSKYTIGGADSALTGSSIDDKVASLKQTVATDQYNLEKAQKTAQISSVDAGTKEQTDLGTAGNAQDTYDQTVNQLGAAVTTAQESYDSLQNSMDEVNNALKGDGTLVSPADGFVASVAYKAGSSVPANTAMMTVSTDDSVSLSLSISEDDITNVSVGQEASISLTAYDDQTIDGLVESITAEPARSGSSSVTYTVVVKSTGKVGDIGTVYDGMSGEGTIIQKRVKDALSVNNRAITFKNGVSTVLVRGQNGGTSAKTVKTGFSDGTSVEITSGLSEGDTVLVESAVSST